MIKEIEGTVRLHNGEVIMFRIYEEYESFEWQQWGSNETGQTVDLMETITGALNRGDIL
jgi:hypothetical protein